MGIVFLLTFLNIFILAAFAVDMDDLPQPTGTFQVSTTGVTDNAQEAVNKARTVFNDAYAKADAQYQICKASPAPPNPTHKETNCILSGVLFNYSLNYATILGQAEEFRRSITATSSITDFSPEETKISQVVTSISELQSLGYFFRQDGRIQLPSPTGPAREIKLADFNSGLTGTVLSAAQVAEINNILGSINPSAPVAITQVAPTATYSVVDASTSTADSTVTEGGDRTIASLNVNYLGTPIGVKMADLFDLVSVVYGELSQDDIIYTED